MTSTAHKPTSTVIARLVLGAATLLAVVCPRASALDPSLDLSQYGHTAWHVRDGVIKSRVLAIAQTPDGYLWLGTDSGLLRFDGVRAIPWQPPNGEQLPGKHIPTLLVARDGTLWIGTRGGVASWKDGRLTNYLELAGQHIIALLQDSKGTVWIGLDTPARVCKIQEGKAQCEGAGTLGVSNGSLYEDRKKNLWVLTQTGLWRWAPGPPERYPVSAPRYSYMTEDDQGTLLLGTSDGLQQLRDGKLESYDFPGVTGRFRARIFLHTSDGSLWVGTQEGLLHLHRGRTDRFTLADGLSGDYINDVFQDREGNVWVGTSNGLDRFRDVAVPTVSINQGLSTPLVFSVESTADGSIWGGTTDGLNRWQNGHMTVYARKTAPSENERKDAQALRVGEPATDVTKSGLSGTILALGKDDSGRLWVASRDGVFYIEGDKFVRVPSLGGGIYAIEGDGHGNLWLLDGERGLLFWKPDGTVQVTKWSQLGKDYFGFSMLPDRAHDGLWLGLVEGGVVYLKDNQVRASYTVADGLGSGHVTGLRLGSDGALWAATEGGLSRIKDGHIATLTTANGLPCDSVHWSMEDDDHALWLYTPCGLVRIARDEMAAWVSDSRRSVLTTTLDAANGVRSVGSFGGYGPHVTKAPDGKLWFLPWDGISVLDPHNLSSNKTLPPVHIEQVTANGKSYYPSNGLRLPPRVRDLTIDYSALSLSVPDKIHFRFKLEGQDKDWREVVNVRQVQYSNLPPGNYRFHVTASNNSGVWNEEGASLDFSIAPAFYQTKWFLALCVAAFFALLYAAYRFRVGQLRRQERKLRDVIETIPTFAWTALPDGSIDFTNRHWGEYTGLSNEKTVGNGWEAAVHPGDLKRYEPKWRASVQAGEAFEREVRFRRADGEYRWFLVRAVPLRNAGGRLIKWYGTSTDIEDRKRAEQERASLQSDLAHINRVSMMGELAASISHELKQPITATMMNASTSLRWLKRDEPDLDEVRDATERIVQDSSRATEIIDRLRSLYKKAPPKRELVDVNEIVREMVVLLRGEANRHAVSIRTDVASGLSKITADRVQLQQVLMNLMLNGIEAMKETGGVLTVKSQLEKDGQATISVSDTGVGLPTEKADEIFNAFFTTKPQGSGMGLAISRSIIESHGGRLWAAPNDGRGATFHFAVPIAADELKVPAPPTW